MSQFRGYQRAAADTSAEPTQSRARRGEKASDHRSKDAQTETLDNLDNSAHEAEGATPPIVDAMLGVFFIFVGGTANVVQIITSVIAFFSMSEGSGIRFNNALDLIKATPYLGIISIIIALAVQSFLHANAKPMSHTLARLRHIQHFNIRSTQSRSDVKNSMDLKSFIFLCAIAADIVGDATFVRLYTSSPFIIGAWVVGLTASSTLLFYSGFTRLWGAIEDGKDYRAYHRQYEDKAE